MQIRKKGTITLPAEFRKRYQLHEDDPITLIDLDEGIFLSPKPSVLPKMVSQIEKLRKKHDLSLTELIEGVRELRKKEG